MRYAIVIEKAEGNYSAYVPDLPDVSRPATRLSQLRLKSAKRSAFISRVSRLMACRSLRQPALRITSRLSLFRHGRTKGAQRRLDAK